MVFSRGDPGLDYLDLHAPDALSTLSRRKNFRLEIVDGADHTFTPQASQNRLFDILTLHLLERFT